jgi:hypothetical protein
MSLRYPVATSGCEPAAAEVPAAGMPFSTIAQGPAAEGGGLSSAPHPASTNMTPASGAVSFRNDGVRITRR